MISGRELGRAAGAAWLCLVMAAPSAGAQTAPAWGLPQLMRGFSQIRSASARFTERKSLHVLTTPLLDTGTLTYVAPNYLQKITVTPMPENFTLDHDVVTMTANGQTQQLALDSAPQLAGLVEGVRATLAGDLPALERFYTPRLSGTPAGWQLLLRPRDAALAHFISWMIIAGHQNTIDTIDTASGNGDHSEMGIVEDTHAG